VPVYVDLLDTIVTDAPVEIVGLDGRHEADPKIANPIAAPPSADALSTTADLFYAMDNPGGLLRPGQRVGVELRLQGDQQARTVPAKSIIYDIYGGTWVYEQSDEYAFQRRRVLVRFTDGDRVVLSEGPPVGTTVVVDGVAELYGTEFGSGK
jgi:cobalt-zinc-cadmium efflux system membrane fusion protein